MLFAGASVLRDRTRQHLTAKPPGHMDYRRLCLFPIHVAGSYGAVESTVKLCVPSPANPALLIEVAGSATDGARMFAPLSRKERG